MDPTQPTNATKPKTSRAVMSRKQVVNQTLSCAECRRLKLRCDRVFPCSSCQKRGIAELCPDGALPTRNKPVTSISDKDQLYQHLSELRGRILELEKALETAHAIVSSEPHPLLSEGLKRKTQAKRKKGQNGHGEDEADESEEAEALDEALGALNMDNEGLRSRYFGRSACVERLFRYRDNSTMAKPSEASILVSAEVAMVYQSFPFLTIGEATNLIQERIWHHLPPLHRAQGLRESYCRHVYHITDIVPRDDWFEDLFARIYTGSGSHDTPVQSFSESGVRVDEMALIFGYFALGALVDLDLTPFNYEAEAYGCLTRAALASSNIYQNATITTIESLILLAYFEAMWGEMIGSGDSWLITGLATKLAQSIGLHRNAMKYGVQPMETKRRNKVYWELYTLELEECLSHGRPSTFSLVPSDVDMPTSMDQRSNYHDFRYKFASECLAPLAKLAFGLRVPDYRSVVELDRKIRKICSDYDVGASGQVVDYTGLVEAEAMKSYCRVVLRESSCLYLHRTFFARSVTINPSDPQHTKYGLSVSGAYDSAMTLVQASCEIYKRHPATAARALLCWNHALCSVFVLGTITTKSPGSRLAPLAAKRLHDMNELYQQASVYGGRAAADAPIVRRMLYHCENATMSYTAGHNRSIRGALSKEGPMHDATKREPEEGEDDELALLGGHTRLIKSSQAAVSVLISPNRNPSPGTTDSGSLSDSGALLADQYPHGHRSISNYRYISQGPDLGSPRSIDHGEPSSSGASASSGMSPLPSDTTAFQQEAAMYGVPKKPVQLEPQNYRGVPGYNYPLEQALPLGVTTDEFISITRPNGSNSRAVPEINYVPMEISLPEHQGWNFLDDWYGHVFQLDVIPPNYGQTT